jgi:transposase
VRVARVLLGIPARPTSPSSEQPSSDELASEVRALRELVESETDRIAELTEALSARDARVTELEKLLEESRRSGKRQAAPFSKGDPAEEPKRPGRKSGDRHGRHGHRMAPVGPIDRELSAPLPACCPDCGGAIRFEREDEQFQTELFERRPTVTRLVIGIGRCTNCKRRVQGRHPEQTSDALGAAASQVGPNAMSLATWLHYVMGLSFKKSASVLGHMGVPVTAGALSSGAQSTGTDLVPVHQEIVDMLNDVGVVVPEETGWRVGGEGAWLWVVTNDRATAYNMADGRGCDQAKELLHEDFSGVIVRDGWIVYRQFTKAEHQTCTACLLRRCHELLASNPEWARSTPREVKEILLAGLDARGLSKKKRLEVVADLTERVQLLGEQARPYDENRKLVAHLTNKIDALFSYLTHPGVDATDWRAEQAVRPAVVNRKLWGGNRTWRRAGTQGRIMSALRTAVQQGLDPIELLVQLARAPDPAAVSLFH